MIVPGAATGNLKGDVITFVREVEHLSFGETLDRLEQIPNPP